MHVLWNKLGSADVRNIKRASPRGGKSVVLFSLSGRRDQK